ncbi:MAG: serine hydrolase [Bacteroidales bacterium]|nr:serine hydrolase [Bacteroidales bacterium]
MRKFLYSCLWCLVILTIFSSFTTVPPHKSRAIAILSRMTLEEKIAQLMIIRISSTETESYNLSKIAEIEQYQVGGVCFFKGGPVREAILTNRIQAVSKVPLFISIDGEWGPAMRLDSCIAFPRQMTLGALSAKHDTLIYQMGVEIAKQCQAVGINLNFAPVVDINNNAKNPVINSRSFGENRDKVTEKGARYLRGMQDGGIIGCLKHFPGHGDTETDSHLGLPVIKKSRIELDELELYPYRQLMDLNPDMIMVGHLSIPALDPSPNSISSLSYPIISELLKKEFGYTGLIITDGLEMKGVQKYKQYDGEIEIKALLAGVDLLLLPDYETGVIIQAIKKAVDDGIIPEELINERCLRVLEFKGVKGLLRTPKPINIQHLQAQLNSPEAQRINDEIERFAITEVKNERLLPLTDDNTVAFLCLGRDNLHKEYQEQLKDYHFFSLYKSKAPTTQQQQEIRQALAPYQKVVIAYGGSNQLANKNYDVDPKTVSFIQELARSKDVVLIHLGNPYALNQFPSLEAVKAVLVAYQFTPNTLRCAVDACFGKQACEGFLPVSTMHFPAGTGITPVRFFEGKTSLLPDTIVKQLDQMLQKGINDKIYPGCVVLAMKDGKMLYHKAFGHFTYDKQDKVTVQTMYDIASVTKTAATTLAVMKLYDDHRFALTDPIGQYLPYLKGTDKANITIAELLTHTSGLTAFIPFYTKIQGDEQYLRRYHSANFSIQVADHLYLRNDYPDTMRRIIAHSKLKAKQYEYSDLNFLLLKEMVEQISGRPMEDFLKDNFYDPMGLKRTTFNPLSHGFKKQDVAPTEMDKTFRKQVVQGYVHDQTSALFYGNAGNAGLFTTAAELGAIYQMVSDGGLYQGQRYLSEETVRLFTSVYKMHGCQERGLGFHTPKASGSSSILPAKAGIKTFGHQGFTGTVVWYDPDSGLLYIFLSNRVYPDCYPNKLSQSRIRLKAHELIYEGLLNH